MCIKNTEVYGQPAFVLFVGQKATRTVAENPESKIST